MEQGKLAQALTLKEEELTDALVALETAAWGRRWSDVKRAREKIERLTGIVITGPLRRALEKARKVQQ